MVIEAYRYLFVWIGFAKEKGAWIEEILQGSWGAQGQEIIRLCKQERGLVNLPGPTALCLNPLKHWTQEVKNWLHPRTQLASELQSQMKWLEAKGRWNPAHRSANAGILKNANTPALLWSYWDWN